MDWWWDFRVDRWSPQGAVNSSIYVHDEFAPYVHAVYLRGARMIQAIRDAVGDQAFFAFLADYAETGTGRIVSGADFFDLLTEYSDADLQPILDEYFEDLP